MSSSAAFDPIPIHQKTTDGVSRTVFHAQLPIIDFTDDEILKPHTDSWVSTCQAIRNAFEEHGGFVAIYDKVPPQLQNSYFAAMEELFDLPLETKMQKTSDRPYHNYFGQFTTTPVYESIPLDNAAIPECVQKFTNTMWPTGNSRFSAFVNSYVKESGELHKHVSRMLFASYGVEINKYDSFIESINFLIRCNKYRVAKENEIDLGLNIHTDLTFLSILLQNQMNGFQLISKEGEYVDIDLSSPTKYLVLAGEALRVWSNDRISPCVHRVVMKAKKVRYSVGLFSFCLTPMHTPEELVDEQNPLRYKPLDHYDFLAFDKREFQKHPCAVKAYCGI